MITGGVASVIYGEPRFTRDIDLVLELTPADIEPLAATFGGGDFHVPPADVLRDEASRGGHFNLIHRDTGFTADVYLFGRDELHAWAIERRRRLELSSRSVWIAPIEYVVIRKLEYFRASGSERHLRDVAMMLRISGDQLSEPELQRWIAKLDLGDLLDRAWRLEP